MAVDLDKRKHMVMEYVHFLEFIESVSPLIGEQKALEILKDNIVQRRIRWYNRNKNLLALSGRLLEDAYTVITERLKILDEAEIHEKGERSITFHVTEQCPLHEACEIKELDPKRFCKAVCEGAANDFLNKIFPGIKFTIEHKKRDGETIAVETIELKS